MYVCACVFVCGLRLTKLKFALIYIDCDMSVSINGQINEPQYQETYHQTCAPNKGLNQLVHMHSLISLHCPHEGTMYL